VLLALLRLGSVVVAVRAIGNRHLGRGVERDRRPSDGVTIGRQQIVVLLRMVARALASRSEERVVLVERGTAISRVIVTHHLLVRFLNRADSMFGHP
jgi:hypothetical protein